MIYVLSTPLTQILFITFPSHNPIHNECSPTFYPGCREHLKKKCTIMLLGVPTNTECLINDNKHSYCANYAFSLLLSTVVISNSLWVLGKSMVWISANDFTFQFSEKRQAIFLSLLSLNVTIHLYPNTYVTYWPWKFPLSVLKSLSPPDIFRDFSLLITFSVSLASPTPQLDSCKHYLNILYPPS